MVTLFLATDFGAIRLVASNLAPLIACVGDLQGTIIQNSAIYFQGGDPASLADVSEAGRCILADAGAGSDALIAGASDDQMDGGSSVYDIVGGDGNDILIGGHGNDRISGGNGDSDNARCCGNLSD